MNKKVILVSLISLILLITGCSFNSSPKAKVESVLMKYQNNSDSVMDELNDYLKTLNISEDSYDDYKKVYTKQYTDLTYSIKDELIDGDSASVTAQIEVYDYYKIDNESIKYINDNPSEFSSNSVYDAAKVLKYKIDRLSKASERVTYTIIFSLSKIDNEWTIDKLSNEDLEKIHGIYAH